MIYKISEACIGCGTCEQACRVGSIPPGGPMAPRAAKPEDKAIQRVGDRYEIRPDKCEGCAGCVAVCPVGAIIAADDTYRWEAHDPIEMDADIVVIGGGGAGLVAAVKAADLGKKVVVLEKMAFAGGGAKFAADWRIFRSQWQKDRNLPDEMIRMLQKGMDETKWALDPKLVYNALRNTGYFFDWFQTLVPDYEFTEGIYAMDRGDPKAQRVPFVRPVNGRSPNGTFLAETLEAECKKREIPLLYRHRVNSLEMTDGKVSAVIAQDPGGTTRVTCRACVMAIGSWIRNEKIMREKFPEFWKLLPSMEPSQHASQAYTGDGIALAEQAGALIDYDSFVLRLMGPLGQVPSMTATAIASDPRCIWVNLDGKRWMNEGNTFRTGMSGSVGFAIGTRLSKQPGGVSYTIFNKAMADIIKAEADTRNGPGEPGSTPNGAPGGDMGMPGMGMMSIPDNYKEELDAAARNCTDGTLVRGDTLEELAKNAGINAENLKKTLEEYNQMCAEGTDWGFFKSTDQLLAYKDGGPYYAAQGHLNHDGAFGGVKIDADMRAWSKDGGRIENLFVPGDFSSGRFLNCGEVKEQVINDLGWAISSGYTAGVRASEYLDS